MFNGQVVAILRGIRPQECIWKVPFCAVGGIELANIRSWLQHYNAVGIGSALYQPGQTLAQMRSRCRQLTEQKAQSHSAGS